MAVFPSLCAPQKDQSGSAADWRPPKSGDQEDDGRLLSDEGSRPSARAEWTMVFRYGHLWSAPVVGVRWCTHGAGTAHAPCSPVVPHAPDMGASSMAFCLSPTRMQQYTKFRGWEVLARPRATTVDGAGRASRMIQKSARRLRGSSG